MAWWNTAADAVGDAFVNAGNWGDEHIPLVGLPVVSQMGNAMEAGRAARGRGENLRALGNAALGGVGAGLDAMMFGGAGAGIKAARGAYAAGKTSTGLAPGVIADIAMSKIPGALGKTGMKNVAGLGSKTLKTAERGAKYAGGFDKLSDAARAGKSFASPGVAARKTMLYQLSDSPIARQAVSDIGGKVANRSATKAAESWAAKKAATYAGKTATPKAAEALKETGKAGLRAKGGKAGQALKEKMAARKAAKAAADAEKTGLGKLGVQGKGLAKKGAKIGAGVAAFSVGVPLAQSLWPGGQKPSGALKQLTQGDEPIYVTDEAGQGIEAAFMLPPGEGAKVLAGAAARQRELGEDRETAIATAAEPYQQQAAARRQYEQQQQMQQEQMQQQMQQRIQLMNQLALSPALQPALNAQASQARIMREAAGTLPAGYQEAILNKVAYDQFQGRQNVIRDAFQAAGLTGQDLYGAAQQGGLQGMSPEVQQVLESLGLL